MRKLSKLIIVSMISFTMISCTSTQKVDNQSGTATPAKTNTVKTDTKLETITFATWAGGGEYDELKAIADKVNAEKGIASGYEIEIMSIPADYYTKLQSVFAAKSSDIDIMWLSQEYTPAYAKLGGLQDITALAKGDSQVSFDSMYEGAKAAGVYEENIYGIPWIVNPVIVYYNKGLTDEAGYTNANYEKWAKGEWDVNEFFKIAKSMTKDLNGDGEFDQYGTYIWDWPPISQWLWNFGGGYIDESNNAIVNSKESVEGFNYLVKMFKEDASALPSAGASNNGMTSFFQSGKVGMILAGSSDGIEKDEQDFEIGYAVVPKGLSGQHQTFPWIGVTSLSAFSDVPQEKLYQAASDMSVEFFGWKVSSPIKGQEEKYKELNAKKANLPVEVIKKSLEIANPGNLLLYAEIGSIIWGGTDGTNGVQQQIYNATSENDYKKALESIDIQAATDQTQKAVESILK